MKWEEWKKEKERRGEKGNEWAGCKRCNSRQGNADVSTVILHLDVQRFYCYVMENNAVPTPHNEQ